jgi:hypothetical protein
MGDRHMAHLAGSVERGSTTIVHVVHANPCPSTTFCLLPQ